MLFFVVSVVAIISCKTHFTTTQETFVIAPKDEGLERGKNLTYNICGQCHYNREIKSFVGEQMHDLPAFMGKLYSANLTNYPAGILPRYSDAEFFYLIKTGIARDGRFIPYMIRPTIADEDLRDILRYLRSNDEAVRGNETKVGQIHLTALGKLATKIAGKPQPYLKGIPVPAETDEIATGKYLIDVIGCYHCHSKSILGLKYTDPERSKGYLAGGYKWKIDGERIYASNITKDNETGIGKYTRQDFRAAVREGQAPNGRMLRYPMRHFKHLTDTQLDAIFAYIQTMPARHHTVKGH